MRQSSSLTVTIRNPGVADLTVTALTVTSSEGTSFTLGRAPTVPFVVLPQASAEVEIVYQPTTVGPSRGTLQISSNAANTPEVTVALEGTAVAPPAPEIIVSPPTLTFGEVEVPVSPKTLELKIKS